MQQKESDDILSLFVGYDWIRKDTGTSSSNLELVVGKCFISLPKKSDVSGWSSSILLLRDTLLL